MIDSTEPILVFADCQTNRLTYVLDFLFKDKGQPYSIVSDKTKLPLDQIHIGYSKEPLNAKICIQPCGLLEETEISSDWQISFDTSKKVWQINQQQDDLALIFYFLSRYEEYVDPSRDNMGRFTAQQSILYQNNQLHIPWCDIMVKNIWEQLSLNYQTIAAGYNSILTYDIDIAWAYKYKPFWRSFANLIKDILSPKQLVERVKVLVGHQNDPYNNYELIRTNAKKHQTLLFFLLGDYGQFDKNHHWKNKKLQNLIQDFDKISDIGIHPSFHSFLRPNAVKNEQQRLEIICQHPIERSRQHFLRMTLPNSYQLLEKNGIGYDYTMGYAEHYGFRAGTSFPFHFFDLEKGSVMNLKVIPFTFMDGTLKDYMGLMPEQAIEMIRGLRKVIGTVGGQFVPLWHNHSIGNTAEWSGWQSVYEACLD